MTASSITDAGEIENGYAIKWDGADSLNYTIIIENLGKLTVTKAQLTVTTGSASKTFDGEALTCDEASITGMLGGENITVTATGSITNAGSATNTYVINWGSWNPDNYDITENLGTLTVTEPNFTFSEDHTLLFYDGTSYKVLNYSATSAYIRDHIGQDSGDQILHTLLSIGFISR